MYYKTKQTKQQQGLNGELNREINQKNTIPIIQSHKASGSKNQVALFAVQKNEKYRIEFFERKAVGMQKNKDTASLCQRFLQHVYEGI